MTLYMLFAGECYYPGGGSDDLLAVFVADTDDEAIALATARATVLDTYQHCEGRSDLPREWAHLIAVDVPEWRVVARDQELGVDS